jgi:hypothetical protein
MALRRRLAGLAAAELHQDDRFLRPKRLLGRRHEGFGPADALDHAGDDAGRRVVDQEVDVVGEIEVELVAARHRIGEIEAAQRGLLQPELERAAGLEHDADAARPQRAHARRGIEQQVLAQRHRAHAVRPGHAQPVRLAQRPHRVGAALALRVAAFAELRRVDQRAFQAVRGRLGERLGDRRRRDDGEGEIDRLGDGGEVGKHRPAPQLAALGVHQVKLGRKAAVLEVLVDLARPAAATGIRSADDRDGLRTQQVVD